jgi:hypothetical protein
MTKYNEFISSIGPDLYSFIKIEQRKGHPAIVKGHLPFGWINIAIAEDWKNQY